MKRGLDQIAVGGTGVVTEIEGADETSLRILEMGLIPGTEVRVVGTAPFGDPLEIEVRGYRLSLRRSEAARVFLQ
jgi:ferrous iron transport protein A